MIIDLTGSCGEASFAMTNSGTSFVNYSHQK